MYTYQVSDMSCGKCAEKITKAFDGVSQVNEVKINVESKEVCIDSSASTSEIIEVIKSAGYSPVEL
ncbi:MAG: heavy-metal-associated domain-containing protein [Candidatus Marinimicrobia bacterium]|jgi:copper chaperone|nr:heavy-metal-associated domain-containing protein [Candidatus Neomarinimicrobiota bacterium]MBT7376833.1 heavy-metal-associated domain-containing protein [Candidatus Neomarinimicrobiota bacterium]